MAFSLLVDDCRQFRLFGTERINVVLTCGKDSTKVKGTYLLVETIECPLDELEVFHNSSRLDL
jgi:hypothetical protein